MVKLNSTLQASTLTFVTKSGLCSAWRTFLILPSNPTRDTELPFLGQSTPSDLYFKMTLCSAHCTERTVTLCADDTRAQGEIRSGFAPCARVS